MIDPPEGYRLIHRGRATLMIKTEYEQPLLDLGMARPEALLKRHCRKNNHAFGRGNVPSLPLGSGSSTQIMVRKYLRGGLVRFVNHDLFFGNTRPFQELLIGTQALRSGIPTALPLAAVSIRTAVFFYRCYLVTRELTGCVDLPRYLMDLPGNSPSAADRKKEKVLVKTAETVRTMHDKGFLHADLNMKNILVDATDPDNIYIIDWDKSVLKNRLSRVERSTNLIRFCRSMAKLAQKDLPIAAKDPELFLSAYWKDSERVSTDLKKLEKSVFRRKTAWKVLSR